MLLFARSPRLESTAEGTGGNIQPRRTWDDHAFPRPATFSDASTGVRDGAGYLASTECSAVSHAGAPSSIASDIAAQDVVAFWMVLEVGVRFFLEDFRASTVVQMAVCDGG